MTPNFTDEKKEYLRMTSRFLKEVGLYDLWIRYCYSPNTSKSWLYEKCKDATDILGKTCFTTWVKNRSNNKRLCQVLNEMCVYELFGEYLTKMNNDNKYVGSKEYLNIDIEKKKVTLK